MTPESIPVRHVSSRSSAAPAAPVRPSTSTSARTAAAFSRSGVTATTSRSSVCRALLTIDAADLERRFRELSRKFHPDFYYNASPAERLASLERSSYLNDAVRTLRNPVTRIEHLLAHRRTAVGAESEDAASGQDSGGKVPPSLLEEVFALNEELDEIRELRESGVTAPELAAAPRGGATADRDEATGARGAAAGAERTLGCGARDARLREQKRAHARGAARAAARAELHQQSAGVNRSREAHTGARIAAPVRRGADVAKPTRAGPFSSAEQWVKSSASISARPTASSPTCSDGTPVVIRDALGDALVPSVVSLDESGTIFVGREAQRRLLTAPSRTVYSVKRFMGRDVEDVRERGGVPAAARQRRARRRRPHRRSAIASTRRRRSPRSS